MSSHLIEAGDLLKGMQAQSLKVLHVQMAPVGAQKTAEPSEFIPGSILFDIEALSQEGSPLPHTALPPEEFAARIRSLGIDSDDEIVVYDRQGVYSSARAWFLFLNAGHSKVRVLNGGLPAWIQAGGTLAPRPAPISGPGSFTARRPLRHFVNRAEVQQVIENQSAVLFDARSAERFSGQVEEPRAGLRRGHIPTAQSTPFASVLEGSRLMSPEDLSRTFDTHCDSNRPVIAYCGSGVTACIIALALEVSGRAPARIYDGSWSEWGQN
jgi:thiosulfate/3-mercaptopyruvate sulfurtransferase